MTGKHRPFPSILLVVLMLLQTSAFWVLPARGAELLGQKHARAGVDCVGCHKQTPPEGPAPPDVCVGCHGDLGKVAERTKKLGHNPHVSHQDELACVACHHLHKPSVDFCAQCHRFGFTVP